MDIEDSGKEAPVLNNPLYKSWNALKENPKLKIGIINEKVTAPTR